MYSIKKRGETHERQEFSISRGFMVMRWNPNGDDKLAKADDYPFEDMKESYAKSDYSWSPDMEDKILRVTKSSNGTFDWCPKQYFFQYIMKLQQPYSWEQCTRYD
jgi:hypothetical protein